MYMPTGAWQGLGSVLPRGNRVGRHPQAHGGWLRGFLGWGASRNTAGDIRVLVPQVWHSLSGAKWSTVRDGCGQQIVS